MIMFVLEWYVYPMISATVIGSMLIAYAWETRKERKEEAACGPHPCMTHLGTSPYEVEEWCFKQYGHDGPHQEVYDYDEGEELRLFPEHVDEPAPADTPSPPGLCRYGEDGGDNVDACWKEAGHDGPHMIVSNSEF